MAKPKRPKWPYLVIDVNGVPSSEGKTLREAREEIRHCDRTMIDVPHCIYVLVTLEEQRIIRAARKLVRAWDDGELPGWRVSIEDVLAEAVEAARGK